MNWNIVWWFAGVCAMFGVLRLVKTFFGSVFSKENCRNIVNGAGDRISEAGESMAEKVKESMEKRKQRKKEENRAIVIQR